MRKEIFLLAIIVISFSLFLIPGVLAVDGEANVCCATTNSGLSCQVVSESECAPGSAQAPTSCESTSFCNPGVCFNEFDGTCSENTPRSVCNDGGGTWSLNAPPQCSLGCCVLGDQAAFVTQTRCKALSSDFGLEANFNSNVESESACILSVSNQDKGACVYEEEFERRCTFTTKALCDSGVNEGGSGEFHVDRLCTDPELNTICAPSTLTSCSDGKEGVYFLDTCGNTANIYDSSKADPNRDLDYWKNVKSTSESCDLNSASYDPKNCGNCNYLQGSVCRPSDSGNRANHGTNICTNLNCEDIGKRHGESWCASSDAGDTGVGKNSVGSRAFRNICLNGEVVIESCADFRQESCIEDVIDDGVGGDFSQAACRVNRWQECTAQTDRLDCENTDRRDCLWRATDEICIPQNAPGLNFWEGEEATQICSQGNAQCTVTYEKKLLGGDEKCVSGCECLAEGWEAERIDICNSLGDCGPNINWYGTEGREGSYEVIRS
jgi:hypothetical protein